MSDDTAEPMHVDVNGTRLWFDVEGAALVPDGAEMRERPTVVLLHGGPGSFDHTYFKPDFARLAEAAQVVYLDLPGHGRSDWGETASWSLERCADAVRELCDTLGVSRPVIYGHSLGGFVAMLYGVRHPDHPEALVFQSTLGRFDLDRMVEDFRRIGGDEVADVVARSYAGDRSVTREEWEPVWKLFGPWVVGDEERARVVVNQELNEAFDFRAFDVLDQLKRIARPTLVCVGELDPATPPAAAREIVDALPAGLARLEVIDGAGHFPWRDAPDAYWPLLIDFLSLGHERDDGSAGDGRPPPPLYA